VSTDKNDDNAYVSSEELIDPYPIIDNNNLYLVYGSFARDRFGKMNESRKKIGVYITQLKYNKKWTTKGKPKFITDYYEGVCIVQRNGRYYLFGTNGAWRTNTYQISYAISKNLTGIYYNNQGQPINDTVNYNSGKIILSTPDSKQRFNGFGCMTTPIIDKQGKYWVMLNGHDLNLQPIMETSPEQERYTFLTQLLWDDEDNPYFKNNTIIDAQSDVPVF
jgi:beta-xylosidase